MSGSCSKKPELPNGSAGRSFTVKIWGEGWKVHDFLWLIRGGRLGLFWYWMVCLGNERRSFRRFWDCIQVLHFGLLLTTMATPFLLRSLYFAYFWMHTLFYCNNAAAAAKSLQSCPTLCDPIDSSPPGSHPWDSPGKNTGVGCHCRLW